jgi:hypothetical protein
MLLFLAYQNNQRHAFAFTNVIELPRVATYAQTDGTASSHDKTALPSSNQLLPNAHARYIGERGNHPHNRIPP